MVDLIKKLTWCCRCLTHHVIMVVQYHLQIYHRRLSKGAHEQQAMQQNGWNYRLIYLSTSCFGCSHSMILFHEIRIELFSWLSIKSSTMLFGIQARRYKTLLVFILFMVGLLKWIIYSTDWNIYSPLHLLDHLF